MKALLCHCRHADVRGSDLASRVGKLLVVHGLHHCFTTPAFIPAEQVPA